MWDKFLDLLVPFVIVAFAFIGGTMAGSALNSSISIQKKVLIERGLAVYEVNPTTGEVSFVWVPVEKVEGTK